LSKSEKKVLLIGAVLFIVALMFPNFIAGTDMLTLAINTIKGFEGFIPVSRWDYKQYSYGYGNAASGPGISISQSDADNLLRQRVTDDYNTLKPLLTIPLNDNQWAALLSFSFNEGSGAAKLLIPDINNQSDNLENHFKEYNIAGGVVNSDLVDRRDQEWQLWDS
jgi:lysozyme